MSSLINLRCLPKKKLLSNFDFVNSEKCWKANSNVRNFFVPKNYFFDACKWFNSSFKSPSPCISRKVVKSVPSLRSIVRPFFESGGADVNTNVSKDVLLFELNKDNFFKVIKYFGITQVFFWGYLAITAYTTLRDSPVIDDGTRELRWFEKINLGENWMRNGITLVCICMGLGLSGFAAVLSARSVKSIVLHKGGRAITLTTYNFIGNHRLTVPLTSVTCSVSRTTKPQHLPLKVKGKWLYYTLDQRGIYPHPVLFDWTAGLKRKI